MIRTVRPFRNNERISMEEFVDMIKRRFNDNLPGNDEIAREYFSYKERRAYYNVDGYDFIDRDSRDNGYIYLTDEEVARLKALIVKDANQILSEINDNLEDEPRVVKTNYYSLQDLIENDEEYNNFFYDRCMDEGLYPTAIDLETRYYFYRFFYVVYNKKDNLWDPPFPFFSKLTDEEYISLLQYQLDEPDAFNFNLLDRKNRDLASKINNDAYLQIYGYGDEDVDVDPYIILLSEVEEDCKKIIEAETKNDDKETTSEDSLPF